MDKLIQTNLIHNLRLLRTERNISAIELTHELNLIGTRIGDIEHSMKRSIRIKEEEMAEIARYFGVDVETLLYKRAYVAFK